MTLPIGIEEINRLAHDLGYTDIREVQDIIHKEKVEAERAKHEAEEAARIEEIRQRLEAEDKEISDALAEDRIALRINGMALGHVESPAGVLCPECHKSLPFARETLLYGIRRATYYGQEWRPCYLRRHEVIAESIPAGSMNLFARASRALFVGDVFCPECHKPLNIRLEVQCVHDGEKLGQEAPCQ